MQFNKQNNKRVEHRNFKINEAKAVHIKCNELKAY